ncbi:MAG: response regulator [Holosporaceae bacterium]|jgi:two-component system cell cycle sensor histidine kinase/response regulator CckA|nr:response regulator [Holosporaceae bacterium]
MDFFIDLEAFLSKKRISFRYFLWTCVFLFFLLFAFVLGVLEGNYFSVIGVSIAGFICFLLAGEIKRTNNYNQLISYQKSLVTNGFDASPFAFFVFSETGKCVFLNRVAQTLFPGFKIKNKENFIFCFGKYPKAVEAINSLRTFTDNMKQSHIDVPIKLQTGNVAIWRIAVSPIPGHKGFSGWIIIDISSSPNKIESLETNSSFLLEIINNSTVGYFSLDEHNEIVFHNKTFADWIGVDNVINIPISKYISENGKTSLFSGNKSNIAIDWPAEITIKIENGGVLKVIVNQISENNGYRSYLVTKSQQQETDIVQALGRTKLYFENIFEDAPLGIAITDGAEIISASNRTFKTFVGSEATDNALFTDFIIEEERESVREKLYELLPAIHKSIPPFEIHFTVHQEKTIMVYVAKIDEIKRSKGNDSLVMYFIDATEKKELRQQFVQSQKMQAVGQLAGGIAHDFNNLLTAMIGYCDLLLEKYLPSDQSFNDIMQIKQNANRASNLVRQLLAFSRQQTLQPKVSSVTDMIGELSALLKRLLGAKIDLKVVHGRDIGFIKVDQIQFEQVVINLAVNARDAMSNGGTLTIQTSSYSSKEAKFLRGGTMPPGTYVLIEVIDTGCGIDKQHLNRIFDPFFSTKEKGHGTGLGLSTVYGIVNQTGGFVSVESEMGKGTKFDLYFPVVSPQDHEISKTNEKPLENKIVDVTGTGTILLVEDEDAVRTFGSRALRDKGYRVIEASNGESALEFIKKKGDSIDLVVTDVVMPKMDGPALMKHIKEYNPNMRVIFISGYTEDNFRESLSNDVNAHFLSKPFNLKELASKVKEVMG